MSDVDVNLLLLFDRPQEPVYVPKGDNKVNFDIPTSYLPEKFQRPDLAQKILSRFGDESLSTVPIQKIAIPDLSLPLELGRMDTFSVFIPEHRRMASRLTELLMGMRTVADLLSLAAYCRDRVNAQMFIHSLSITILHRQDTRHLSVPQLHEIFPDRFIDSAVFHRAREESNVLDPGTRVPIDIPLNFTATDADPEHRVAYWREDIGINLHHWHWHLIYPFDGPVVAVNKDRRGELFYHMHHQMMSRHNTERLCNGLARAKPMSDFRAPIPEAYFPKIDQMVAGRSWPSRPAGYVLSDIDRQVDKVKLKISDLELYRDRIVETIKTGIVRRPNGESAKLEEENGIDVLGNIIESSNFSPNHAYYGDLHNSMHYCIAYCHDPDHRYLESFGIMGDSTTAVRDPVFYRWHGYVDDLFKMYKDTLTPYTSEQLTFPGINVVDVRVKTPNGNPNTLNTHWTKSEVDLSRGLDFTPRGSVLARFQHLNHDNFVYTIMVTNSTDAVAHGTVRIFVAPKFDENGSLLAFENQRYLMIEMDKFTTKLSKGQNVITRNSVDSTLTIPYEATFRNVDRERPDVADVQGSDRFNFCGCGWPQHMLVPKGTKHGYPMDLFVMVTNLEIDKVDQATPVGCIDGMSFCGLRDLKYPDTRPMGYPFDRRGREKVKMLSDFLTPNMKAQQITVRFTDVVKPR